MGECVGNNRLETFTERGSPAVTSWQPSPTAQRDAPFCPPRDGLLRNAASGRRAHERHVRVLGAKEGLVHLPHRPDRRELRLRGCREGANVRVRRGDSTQQRHSQDLWNYDGAQFNEHSRLNVPAVSAQQNSWTPVAKPVAASCQRLLERVAKRPRPTVPNQGRLISASSLCVSIPIGPLAVKLVV